MDTSLVFATYNVNGIRSRMECLRAWLAERQPDLVALQEIKCKNDSFPFEDLNSAGYRAEVHGQPGFNGVAILTKTRAPSPTLRQRGLPGMESDPQARYLEVDWMGLRVASVYLPNGNPVGDDKFRYKLTWMSELRSRSNDLYAKEIPFVLMGDFNVASRTEDVYDTAAMAHDAVVQPVVRRLWREMLHQGLVDAWENQHGLGVRGYTYWDYRGNMFDKNKGLRLDYVLMSPPAADMLRACEVDASACDKSLHKKPSDHAPLWCRLSVDDDAQAPTQ